MNWWIIYHQISYTMVDIYKLCGVIVHFYILCGVIRQNLCIVYKVNDIPLPNLNSQMKVH